MTEKNELLLNLPHSFPFRMIDRVLHIEPGKNAMAIKQVSLDAPFIQGHFPKAPILPGVLILEALAQTAGLAFHSSFEKEETGIPFLARVDRFRLRRIVTPGEQLTLEAEILHIFSHLAKVKVLATVGEETVAEGIFILAKIPSSEPLL
jgi:3-hydroxyacyl-[acyl-carrier-protein] dehydratase